MKRVPFLLAIALLAPTLLAAQAKSATTLSATQQLILEFVNGNALTVTLADRTVLALGSGVFEGDAIPVGSTIATGAGTSAELKLKPNGSIIKLAKMTTFTVAGLASSAQDKNAFSVAAGKVRAVAAKGGAYELRSQTAVCGVRGTDFAFNVEGGKALLMVAKGLVQFDKIDAGGNVLGSLGIGAGQAADALASSFAAFAFSAEQFAEQFADVAFEALSEADVPQAEPESAAPTEPTTPAEPVPPAPTVPGTTETTPVSAAEAAALLKPDKEQVESGLVKWLREVLGFELGSVTINGTTYSKAIIQPNLNLGKLKLGLYLPIIYTNDLFDPEDWYHPAGNDEWSFGAPYWEQEEYLKGVIDAAQDLALKIKYFEFGQPLVDPFFIKVGNLETLTIGHGLIMRNYANNTEFPAVRRVGFNLGIDGGGIGFEALVNDLAAPEIFGTRLYIRPIKGFKLAFGLSGVVDISPWKELPNLGTIDDELGDDVGDLMLVGTGVDLDLPIITSGLLSIRLFADGAVILPWVMQEFEGVTAGFETTKNFFIGSDGVPRNWGVAGGLMGNVLFIDWRLEYRYFTGLFKPSFFDTTYDKNRAGIAKQYASYLSGAEAIDQTPTIMGIYGEGGFKILKDKMVLEIGYMWPWSPDADLLDIEKQLTLSSDELHAELVIRKGLIPIFDVAGSISYDRRGVAMSLYDAAQYKLDETKGKPFSLIDERTTFGGELVVPVPKSPNLDVAVIFQTVPVRDKSSGDVVYETGTTIPKLTPSISIETRFHF